MSMRKLKTDALLDCFLYVRGDTSMIENKKKVMFVQILLNEKVVTCMINKTAEQNLPDHNIDQLDGDSDTNILKTVEV